MAVWLWQLACALCALSEAKILHMDIKVDNILLTQGEDGGIDNLLLADFGIAREMPTRGPTQSNAIAVGQEHVAIEMDDFMKKVHQSLLKRLDVQASTMANVEGDITAIMTQYVSDESGDMCKNLRGNVRIMLIINLSSDVFFHIYIHIKSREFWGGGPPSFGKELVFL